VKVRTGCSKRGVVKTCERREGEGERGREKERKGGENAKPIKV
jgi:hypothetical protein